MVDSISLEAVFTKYTRMRVMERVGYSITHVFPKRILHTFIILFLLNSCSREWNNSLSNEDQKTDRTGYILNEDFEDNNIDNRVKINKTGSFSQEPGIKDIQNFGSTKAFGFGRSTCFASCFDSYQTSFKIEFSQETYISDMYFKEMELYGNWGSQGSLYIDGEHMETIKIGGTPINSRNPDTVYRTIEVQLNKLVSVIEIVVTDITSSSEIFIDDLIIFDD